LWARLRASGLTDRERRGNQGGDMDSRRSAAAPVGRGRAASSRRRRSTLSKVWMFVRTRYRYCCSFSCHGRGEPSRPNGNCACSVTRKGGFSAGSQALRAHRCACRAGSRSARAGPPPARPRPHSRRWRALPCSRGRRFLLGFGYALGSGASAGATPDVGRCGAADGVPTPWRSCRA
jgi:hypothetical protein